MPTNAWAEYQKTRSSAKAPGGMGEKLRLRTPPKIKYFVPYVLAEADRSKDFYTPISLGRSCPASGGG